MNEVQVPKTNLGETRPLRVVQWATGNIGSRSLRCIIEHPNMALAGVFVHGEAKAGRDAGELCGLPPVGILSTRDVEQIIGLRPDCVLYMPQGPNMDDVCRLLGAGINIVTTRGEFHHPASMDPAVRERIDAACAAGRASIHSTGSSPGFITEGLPLTLLSLQRRLDCLHIHEYADLSSRNSPELLFGLMGFGQAPNPAMTEARAGYLRHSFGPSLTAAANAVGLTVDSIDAVGDVACAVERTQIAAGAIDVGTVAAQRTTVRGLRNGVPLVTFSANWYCTRNIDADWKLGETGWSLAVEGDVPLEVDIRFPVPLERWAEVSPGLTAHRAVNAVPFVCAAAPGIRTTVELPHVVPVLC